LLREFGSVANVQRAGVEGLSRVITRKSAEKILAHLNAPVEHPDEADGAAAHSDATDRNMAENGGTDSKVTTTTS
jgi:ERCC4-type nuclease